MSIKCMERYSRQAALPQIGWQRQQSLAAATVVIVGCGGLGTVSAGLLARAGIGHVRLIDGDRVEIVNLAGQAEPVWLLVAFFALTTLLTQAMSNQAAAVVVLPVAVHTASQLSLNPRTFAVIVALAASCSFLTPLEPSCLLVYGPGRYRFVDFLKVGALLTLVVGAICTLLVPAFWPL